MQLWPHQRSAGHYHLSSDSDLSDVDDAWTGHNNDRDEVIGADGDDAREEGTDSEDLQTVETDDEGDWCLFT